MVSVSLARSTLLSELDTLGCNRVRVTDLHDKFVLEKCLSLSSTRERPSRRVQLDAETCALHPSLCTTDGEAAAFLLASTSPSAVSDLDLDLEIVFSQKARKRSTAIKARAARPSSALTSATLRMTANTPAAAPAATPAPEPAPDAPAPSVSSRC